MGNVIAKTAIRALTKKMAAADEAFYAQKKECNGITEQQDISYADGLTMDFYTPTNQQPCDIVIVDIHGGAWVYGDKRWNRHFCMHMAAHGFAVFNINYRLVPDVSVKQQLQDIFLALRYIKERENQYGIQGFKICLAGDSAGAHLASLAACICKDAGYQRLYAVDAMHMHIDMLLLQHGIYDLKPMKSSSNFMMKKLYGWMYPKAESTLRAKDCLTTFLDESWDIPIFLLSSTGDEMFVSQTMHLATLLDQYQKRYELLCWENKELNHVFHISQPDGKESQESFDRMSVFLKTVRNPSSSDSEISSV